MRKRLLLLCAGTFFLAGQIRAQWVVTDPGNLAQSIININSLNYFENFYRLFLLTSTFPSPFCNLQLATLLHIIA